MKDKLYEVNVYNKVTHEFMGTIMRAPLRQKAFGNWGAIQYSIVGKKVWSVGGQDVYLEPSLLEKLQEKEPSVRVSKRLVPTFMTY